MGRLSCAWEDLFNTLRARAAQALEGEGRREKPKTSGDNDGKEVKEIAPEG